MYLRIRLFVVAAVCSFFSINPTNLVAATSRNTLEEEAWSHIVVMNGLGDPKRPRISESKGEIKVSLENFTPDINPAHAGPSGYQAYVNHIRDQILASGNKKVIFFIHGGMNVNSGAAERAVRLLKDGKIKGYYPIFICWNSPPTGYFSQTYWVRAGKTEQYGRGQVYAALTTPFQVLADCGRAVTRLPLALSTFAYNDAYSMRPQGFTEYKAMRKEYSAYRGDISYALPPDQQIGTELREDHRSVSDRIAREISMVATIPVKVATHPLVDSIGVGAWNNMLRHTDTMFEHVPRYKSKEKATPGETARMLNDTPTGALAIFLQALSEDPRICAKKMTLVGHSMGAIISNRIVTQYPKLYFENIVYMAGACRVADFEQSVIPYMESPNHSETKFYNLSLNPVCETGEIFAIGKFPMDVAPRGSLLVWIDNIFGNPPSEQRRMLGIYQTALLASHNVPIPLRKRVFYKAFAAVPLKNKFDRDGMIIEPQKHGDFSDAPFWRPEFWSVDTRSANH